MNAEELLAKILSQLADKLKNDLILKGGMLLRLLNSPRGTQDLDYAWIQKKKRSLLADDIRAILSDIENLEVTGQEANSRGIFLDLRDKASGTKAKIEINVVNSTHLPPKPISSAPLTHPYFLPTRIVSAMDPSEAFAHKIAASIERSLIRDLYDLTQLEILGSFHLETLQERLSKIEIGRSKPKAISLLEAANLLEARMKKLTQKKIEDELGSSLPDPMLPGLEQVIRSTVGRIIQKLKES